jgi:hypothetical protein
MTTFFGGMPQYEASFPATDFDMSLMFECLSKSQIVAILGCLIKERKVLFLSSQVKKLTHIIQGFLTLLWPFNWVELKKCTQTHQEDKYPLSAPSSFLGGLPWLPGTLYYRISMGRSDCRWTTDRQRRGRSVLGSKGSF